MSTRYKVDPYQTTSGMKTGLEGVDIPADFDMPSCGIEDVDRALFKLFNDDLPFFYENDGDIKRIPCIFAGGERAMILRRKEALRDRQGALILPLVSILRNGIDQEAEKGIGPGDGTLTIKKRLAPEDIQYKRLVNQQNLGSQDNTVNQLGPTDTSLKLTAKNIYEVITIPSPRFFKATYDITFWAQYLTQMNSMVEAFISSYNINPARTFKIESDKGYWFVATVESGLNDSTNFDSYLDEERLIKTSLTMSVTGYIINPKFPGAPSPFRRYVSAPKIQFETSSAKAPTISSNNLPSSEPDDYVFDEYNTDRQPLPGTAVASVDYDGPEQTVTIGGHVKDQSQKAETVQKNLLKNLRDPFDDIPVKASIKSKNIAKGETVFIIMETLDKQ